MTRIIMRLKSFRVGIYAGLAFPLLAGPICVNAQDNDRAPGSSQPVVQSSDREAPGNPSEAGELAPEALVSSRLGVDYRIGPEDILDIEVFQLPELKASVRVSNEGTINLPLLGSIKVAGLTTAQLRRQLELKYGATYLQNPQVSIFVREFHSQPVTVVGAVERPGTYQLTGSRSLIEMLSQAGGPSRSGFTAGRTILVTRKGGFGPLEMVDGMRLVAPDQLEINLQGLVYTRVEALNIEIKPFDTITVANADIVYVTGEVRRPGAFVLDNRESVTVIQALALADGLSSGAKKKSVIIRVGNNGIRTRIPVDVDKIMRGKAEDLRLASNDILYVPSDRVRSVGIRVAEVAGPAALASLILYHVHF